MESKKVRLKTPVIVTSWNCHKVVNSTTLLPDIRDTLNHVRVKWEWKLQVGVFRDGVYVSKLGRGFGTTQDLRLTGVFVLRKSFKDESENTHKKKRP